MDPGRIEIKPILISLTAIAATEMAIRPFVTDIRLSGMAVTGIARAFECILMILVVWRFGRGLGDIGLHRSALASGLKQGLIWSASFGLVAAIAGIALYVAGIDPRALIVATMPSDSTDIILLFCTGGLVAPIAEEILFRGMIYRFFRRWGIPMALLLSTLIFVLVHPVTHQIPVPQIVGGLVFALAYEVSGSLITPITIHILGNSAIYAISLLFG